ncbi:MAG TPA: Xaa-Pro peptidase family protein, partial [Candidatus Nanoarchaeia archaeon]|nr:Xaa-Pro peptidase family protein [Candidatus Nanoarchaeia archaeon]
AVLLNSDGKPNSNFVYFTDVPQVTGFLIIPSSGSPVLLTSLLEYGIAKRHSMIKKVVAVKKSYKDMLKKYLKGDRIGVDFSNLSVSTFKKLKKELKKKFVDISSHIHDLRMVKTPEEISRMRKAASLASLVISKAIAKASSRMTELDMARFIDMEMFKLDVLPSFPTIVASGKNSKNPHHIPSDSKLKGFTVIDMGVICRNYCSDISRTIYIGTPSSREISDYEKVLQVQHECLDVHAKSPKYLNDHAKKRLGKHFIHSLGHGIGLDVHESPNFNSPKKLKDSTIVAIEPGLYTDYGIRIEDDVLVKKIPEILTKFTKKLIVKK